MTYQKINVVSELRKLAKGNPTKVPVGLLAELVIPRLTARLESHEVSELERLFCLPDTRHTPPA